MSPRTGIPASAPAATAATVLALGLGLLATGCSQGGGGDPGVSGSTAAAKPAESAEASPSPRTPEDYLARAREAMGTRKGWTFSVTGSEGLTSGGQGSIATYKATVNRTGGSSTSSSRALHSTGSTTSKGAVKPEEIYVADGTVHIKKGVGGSWKSGPLSDPEMADAVEDPMAALDEFAGYVNGEPADGGSTVTIAKSSGGSFELKATVPSDSGGPRELSAVRDQGVVKQALRELRPTLDQLRAAGVAVSESAITVERAEEVLTLDPATYRITSHRFRCAFLIPYGGQNMRYSQDVNERTQGEFTGSIVLPAAVKAGAGTGE